MLGLILALIIGGVAGYIAEQLMKANHGLVTNVILGVAGSLILNIIFGIFFGIEGGNILWQLLLGIIGASLLIWGYREYKRRN